MSRFMPIRSHGSSVVPPALFELGCIGGDWDGDRDCDGDDDDAVLVGDRGDDIAAVFLVCWLTVGGCCSSTIFGTLDAAPADDVDIKPDDDDGVGFDLTDALRM